MVQSRGPRRCAERATASAGSKVNPLFFPYHLKDLAYGECQSCLQTSDLLTYRCASDVQRSALLTFQFLVQGLPVVQGSSCDGGVAALC